MIEGRCFNHSTALASTTGGVTEDCSRARDKTPHSERLAHYPEVLAYSGESLPLQTAIGQTAQCLRHTDHLSKSGTAQAPQLSARVAAARMHLTTSLKTFPRAWAQVGGQLVFVGFDQRLKKPAVYGLELTAELDLETNLTVGKESKLEVDNGPLFFGSGAETARACAREGAIPFECLIQAIRVEEEPTVGGPPQGYRVGKKSATPIGFVWGGKPYFGGMEMHYRGRMEAVEWRDEDFRHCKYPKGAGVRRR